MTYPRSFARPELTTPLAEETGVRFPVPAGGETGAIYYLGPKQPTKQNLSTPTYFK